MGDGVVRGRRVLVAQIALAAVRDGRVATLAGDNRLVTDYGRFRRHVLAEGLQHALDGHIAAAEQQGWIFRWVLLTHRTNGAANRLAQAARAAETCGLTRMAGRLNRQGRRLPWRRCAGGSLLWGHPYL